MEKLILEDFRCFAGRHEVNLSPLTLLVGENSTGKSSFLAASRIASDVFAGRRAAFNEEPFRLGAFEQIVRTSKSSRSKPKKFVIGLQDKVSPRSRQEGISRPLTVVVEGTFVDQDGQPVQSIRSAQDGMYSLTTDLVSRSLTIVTPTAKVSHELDAAYGDINQLQTDSVISEMRRLSILSEINEEDWVSIRNISQRPFAYTGFRPYAFAPVRSKPQRTYDPVGDNDDTEDSRASSVLSRLLRQPNSRTATRLRESLMTFGESSQLFDDIEVRPLGSIADPFQIVVKQGNATRNLIDVGYGVSQILPIIVDILRSPPPARVFLIQQPEVHLHPRAQAAFASLALEVARTKGIQLLIETHSDYIIDRVRMDVRDNESVSPDDVGLLYFESAKSGVAIHEISFDKEGNVLNAPPYYRQFFLDESMKSFGVP